MGITKVFSINDNIYEIKEKDINLSTIHFKNDDPIVTPKDETIKAFVLIKNGVEVPGILLGQDINVHQIFRIILRLENRND